jgi:hypothetical protein
LKIQGFALYILAFFTINISFKYLIWFDYFVELTYSNVVRVIMFQPFRLSGKGAYIKHQATPDVLLLKPFRLGYS